MKKNKVLIVDDEPVNIAILKEILDAEYETSYASSGNEAIILSETFLPDLILLDIMLPDADGYELCRKIKNSPKTSNIKIILVSVKNSLQEKLIGYESGADDYITKPFEPEEVLAKTKVFLRLKNAEQINEEKKALLNIFCHETRTPLNAIVGFANLLINSRTISKNDAERARHILSAGNELLTFISKIVLLEELKNGTRKIILQKLKLSQILSLAMNTFSTDFKNKKIKVNIEVENDEKFFDGDEELILFSINCLLKNALVHNPETSSIKIKIFSDAQNVYFSIFDNGPGIPENLQKEIFSEFVVADINHHGRGHGLSLPIVKLISELHGGTISLQNNSPSGSIFSLSFPLEK
ncbi:MAG: hybrid sensor histidine kinase/response regulator [Candidatus Nanoarchaeia archaeon]